jgi:hypothetical protein
LKEGGILILGVSETAGVQHPDLIGKNRNNLFYFQKSAQDSRTRQAPETYSEAGYDYEIYQEAVKLPASPAAKPLVNLLAQPVAARPPALPPARPQKPRKGGLSFDVSRLGDILSSEECAGDLTGRVKRVLEDRSLPEDLNGNELAASALYLLKEGDFSGAGSVLDYMEALDDSAITAFLRGEYFLLQDLFTEAELYYRISLGKNDAFWPAGYRLSSLSSADLLKKYRVEKALEGLHRGRDLHYEVLIGGFSPDYYAGALLKQNAG